MLTKYSGLNVDEVLNEADHIVTELIEVRSALQNAKHPPPPTYDIDDPIEMLEEMRQRLDELIMIGEMEQGLPPTVYLDIETTGLIHGTDEVIEIAIVDDNGDPLVNTMVMPKIKTRWPEAQKIHGIAPIDVAGSVYLDHIMPRLEHAVKGKRLVIYNAPFDLGFFPVDLENVAGEVCCCMRDFARHMGIWNFKDGEYERHKLAYAALWAQHTWKGKAHAALADAFACKAVFEYIHDYYGERQRVDILRATDAGYET